MGRPSTIRGAIDMREAASSPRTLLALLAVTSAATLMLLVWLLPGPQVLPAFSLAFLAAAAAVAPLASSTARRDAAGFTLADFAGALAFLGFAAGMLSEPAEVAALFGLAPTSP